MFCVFVGLVLKHFIFQLCFDLAFNTALNSGESMKSQM
ncbi:unnamed protein product [Callosobruchus maculatus]|uniref:Uncharacterized protein n=1 Tax=Callosobruchus maculatus TaxID=64391 RepID=A0A653CGA7_CALMS|nr:unnamed protein product [Callosobruchus maculatus]